MSIVVRWNTDNQRKMHDSLGWMNILSVYILLSLYRNFTILQPLTRYCFFFQVEMTGSSFFDYIHHADHSEVAEQLGLGLAQSQNIASPGSANSEDGSVSNTGTANPDGKIELA